VSCPYAGKEKREADPPCARSGDDPRRMRQLTLGGKKMFQN
jgi:hypothetical protein